MRFLELAGISFGFPDHMDYPVLPSSSVHLERMNAIFIFVLLFIRTMLFTTLFSYNFIFIWKYHQLRDCYLYNFKDRSASNLKIRNLPIWPYLDYEWRLSLSPPFWPYLSSELHHVFDQMSSSNFINVTAICYSLRSHILTTHKLLAEERLVFISWGIIVLF